jgi:hypothetical protein
VPDPGGVSDTYHPPPQGFYISKGTIGFQKDTIGFQKSQTSKAIKVGENLCIPIDKKCVFFFKSFEENSVNVDEKTTPKQNLHQISFPTISGGKVKICWTINRK